MSTLRHCAFSVTRENTTVWLRLSMYGPLYVDDEPLWFKRNCASVLEAQLLYDTLSRQLDAGVRGALSAFYERGYRDGRGKKQKRKYFPGQLWVTKMGPITDAGC